MASEPSKPLEELIRELPQEFREEVRDFIEFLLMKRRERARPSGKFKMTWAGGLREYRDTFTSTGLQQKAMEWWVQGIRDEVSR
ncbi:hypothetical protein HRbin08_00224 [bacterium HR08]|nr:hypothetical protein HRbin08_00224 [bacterium HR08]